MKILPCPFCDSRARVACVSVAPAYLTVTCNNVKCGASPFLALTEEEVVAMWNNRPTPPTPTTRAFNRLDRVVCIRADGCPELSVGKLYVVRLYQPGVHHLTNTVSGCVTLYNVKPRDIGVECYDSSRFTLAVDGVPG